MYQLLFVFFLFDFPLGSTSWNLLHNPALRKNASVVLCVPLLEDFFYDKTKRFKRIIVSYIYSKATRSAVFDKSPSIHHFFFVVLYYLEQILLQVLLQSLHLKLFPRAFSLILHSVWKSPKKSNTGCMYRQEFRLIIWWYPGFPAELETWNIFEIQLFGSESIQNLLGHPVFVPKVNETILKYFQTLFQLQTSPLKWVSVNKGMEMNIGDSRIPEGCKLPSLGFSTFLGLPRDKGS